MEAVDKSKAGCIDIQTLTRWSDAEVIAPEENFPCADGKPSPFLVDAELNAKIILWRGDICSLDIDAIVNTTNERLTDRSGICGRIFHLAGPQMRHECERAETCPTGDAIITRGGNLLARHVIHTVGPRFSLKYQTAAENALHGCYRRSLEQLREAAPPSSSSGLSSIAFPVVNTERKGYPRKPAAHIAFRTVRKFMAKYGQSIHTIVFCVDADADLTIYEELLPLYFPRTLEEEQAAVSLLPSDLGNDLGETVIEDRKIRIGSVPLPDEDARAARERIGSGKWTEPPKPLVATPFNENTAMRESSFTQMQDHPDDMRQKRDGGKPKAEREADEEERRYNTYLRQSQEENLSDMEALNFIYNAGKDASGRPVIAFIASNIPAGTVDMHRVTLYMLRVLDPVVAGDFNVIYFHSLFASKNKPPFAWLREVYGIFNRKYKKNMKRIFIVHPSFWTKMVIWFAKPFVSKKVWKKLFYIHKLREIYEYFDPSSLKIPEPIHQYDQDLFGAVYAKSEGVANKYASKDNDGL